VIAIPRREKGGMGQSNVWYAEKKPEFVKLVEDYIYREIIPIKFSKSSSSKGLPRQLDPLKRLKVEENAIKIVTKHYKKLGYDICSVEKDNVGWDLTATNERAVLKLEVKGLSGNLLSTEITSNEYKNLKADKKNYRLCIVTETLGKKPKLKIFAYSEDTKAWTCKDGTILKFEDRIGARIYI